MVSNKDDLSKIFLEAVEAVQPQRLMENAIRVEGRKLFVLDREYYIKKNCFVVGFGKAVLGMATLLEQILGDRLTCGIATVPHGIFKQFADLPQLLPKKGSRITFIEGAAGNIPDSNAYQGALKIRKLVSTVDEDDILIVLISGGGSSLLPLPVKPITLEEKVALIRALGKAGATIIELNTVRKRISELKGGGLALLAHRAHIISLIISDVVGDPLDFIASGPTVKNVDEDTAALNVLIKYNLLDFASDNVKQVLTSKCATSIYGTKPAPQDFTWVYNVVIGNNTTACQAASAEATKLGYQSVVLTTTLVCDIVELSQWYSELLFLLIYATGKELEDHLHKARSDWLPDLIPAEKLASLNPRKPICIIAGGEPVCVVKGKGRGGRNTELALRLSVELNCHELKSNVSLLCAGTDGMDGPTDAAGAYGGTNLYSEAMDNNLEINNYLENSDSYGFYRVFKNGEYILKTGHTGTNVMDLHIITIMPKMK